LITIPKTEEIMAQLTRIEELLVKGLLGEMTPEEHTELEALAQVSEENRLLIERMQPAAFHQRRRAQKIDYRKLDKLFKEKTGMPGIFEGDPAPRKAPVLLFVGIAAASILLIVCTTWWFSHRSKTVETLASQPIAALLSWHASPSADITITAFDSKPTAAGSIDLGAMEEGRAYKAGAILIRRMNNQFFIIRRYASVATADTLPYDLTVEGKQEIQVFFPDTMRVQLSPGTRINFPIYPEGAPLKKRQLACDGQALFDVNHNYAIPTVVKMLKQNITVLGTLFKVRDYKTEDTSGVFCYTGKVAVQGNNSSTQTLLPSQRVTVLPRHELKVSTGDFPEAHWSSKELYFNFSQLNLESAMKQIAQWYDIKYVTFENGIDKKTPGKVFTGNISRFLSLPQLLSILERNDLHFDIRAQEIHVKGRTTDHSH
jgi:transmembrane sensor